MLSPDEIRERFARVQAAGRAGGDRRRRDEVRRARRDGGARRGGGRGRRREPRAGPRGQARRVRRRVPLALHRPSAVEQGEGRQPDLRARPLARLATRRRGGSRCRRSCRSTSPARHRRRASPPDEIAGVPALRRPRPLDDAARRRRPRGVARRGSRACASWPPSTGCASSRWARRRTSPSLPKKERRTSASAPCSFATKIPCHMALGDLWNRTLVYFGIAEEDDDWEDEDGFAAEESLEQSYRERPNVRRLTPRRRGQDFDDWTESEADAPTARVPAVRAGARAAPRARAPSASAASRRCRTRRSVQRAPRPAAQLQRRAADRRQVQAGRSR